MDPKSIKDSFIEATDKFASAVKNVGQNLNRVRLNDFHYFESTEKIDDIKQLLEADGDNQKLEGVKRTIWMISKGKDASPLFPNVVKNVVSKNIELKKLVYMYLVHYAEKEPDNALLAINSFQKDLGNSNQFIRASALRVLSSIRVKLIVQIIIMSIQKGIKDTSPYVRKTAAHAISKVYNLDRDTKNELIEIIKILLADRNTMVLGGSIAAFSEVCPDRLDLLHPHYRKIAHLLPDIDEWGQIIVINTLLRYARTQFPNPDAPVNPTTPATNGSAKPKKKNNSGFEDDEEEEEEEEEEDDFGIDVNSPVDPDLRILLDSCNPLMKSRNSGVILAVSSVYYYLAPQTEAQKVAKTIVRLVKNRKEVSYVALANIATIAKSRPSIFEPFLAEFFVLSTDPSYCKSLKLEIITLLATQDNINKILKELKSYVNSDDKTFAASAIQAIGRCAQSVPEITDRCLQGLMALLTNPSDTVVAESIVVIKKLLQRLVAPPTTTSTNNNAESNSSSGGGGGNAMVVEDEEEAKQNAEQQEATLKEIVTNLTILLETIQNPKARESIVWVVGEYSTRLPKLAPDVLRQMAKSFANEEQSVKVQVLNLGNKLMLSNPEQSTKIFEYILNLARYDTSYDVRDKARVIKKLLVNSGILAANAKKLIFVEKPVPTDVGPSEGRQRFVLGTLSHLLNQTVSGYHPLPDWTTSPTPRSIRDEPIVEPVTPLFDTSSSSKTSSKSVNVDNFWDDEDEEEEGEEEEEEQEEEDEDVEENPKEDDIENFFGDNGFSTSKSTSVVPDDIDGFFSQPTSSN